MICASRRNGKGLQQGRDRMPYVMDLESDVVRLADAPERPDKVPGLDRTPRLGGEDKIRLRPGRTHPSAIARLGLNLGFQDLARQLE